ncbi:WD40 repeat-containing protein MSI4-like protein [Tanacetum coccineum]
MKLIEFKQVQERILKELFESYKDKTVVLWSIHDHISTLATQPGITKSVGSDDKPAESPVIQTRGVFHRHEDTVEDVQFCPSRDKVVDFHWNAHDPWTIVSVSNDDESTGGGGTLQIWRMIDLIYRPEQEATYFSGDYTQSEKKRKKKHLWEGEKERLGNETLTLRLTETDGSVPNTLVIANYEIVKPRVAAAEHISQFSEEARSPYVKKFKTIIHPEEFCSVGDDSCLILWDARTGSSLVVKVEKAHDADLHCVDWNPIDEDLILTGSADNTIRLFDRRNLTTNGIGAPVHIFENHTAAVLCVQVKLRLA